MNFEECTKRLKELYDKRNDEDYSLNENYKKIGVEFNEVFLKLIETSITEKKYFSSSPLDLFKIELNKRLEINSKQEIDFDEVEYIKQGYLFYNKIYRAENYHVQKNEYYFLSSLNSENNTLFRSIMRKRIEYLEKFLFTRGIEVITHRPYPNDERINFEFKKHLNIMVENDNLKPIEPFKESSLSWTGEQTEFMELFKALILNGSITGTGNQLDKINQLANFLNFEINNPYKLLNDIKTTRNNGSETLFLDKLKKTFYDYITLEKIK